MDRSTGDVGHYDLMAAARRYRAGGTGPKATLLALVERLGEHDAGEWTCWPKQTTIAADTEQSVRTVRRHLSDFESTKLIAVEARSTPQGRLANVYVLDVERLLAGAPQPDTMTGCATGQPEQPNRTPDAAQRVADDRLLHISQAQEEETTEPRARDVDRAETERQFEHFWNVYPKRNGKRLGRSDALMHFGRLSLDDRRAAYRGAVNYAAAVDAGATIAADAFRWLRKRQFEDWQTPAEITPARQPARPNVTDRNAENAAEFLRLVNGGRS